MKCTVVMLLVFASIYVVQGQSQSSPAKRDERHTQNTKKPEPKPSASNTVVVIEQETASAQNEGAKSEPKSYFARLFAPENLPNIALFVVGVGGIIVAICTLKIIQRQTEHVARQAQSMRYQTTHLKDSVEAALLNAQALINSERPWIDVTVIPNNTINQPGYFFFRVTNTGRTPAQFISGGFSHDFRPNADALLIPAMYAPFFAPNTRFLPPGAHFDIQRSLAEASTGIRPQSFIEQRQHEPVPMNPGDILFLYGNIVYDDVLGKDRPGYKPHETRWCFAYFPNGMRIVRTGPDGENGKEYNNYT